jgi:predicted RNA-binding Zn ribbon-like protein
MKQNPRRPPQFELIAGVVCLDFANTLDDRFSGQPKELLPSYIDLLRFGEESKILSFQQEERLVALGAESPDRAQRVLREAHQLREAMYEIFWALVQKKPVSKTAIMTLNTFVQAAAQRTSLVPGRAHFQWQFDPSPHLEMPLWPIARSAAELLASDQLEFVHACASETCDWFFLDESKNHRRRWCDMTKCGNRAKLRRFYKRKKKQAHSS